jgi:putative phosphoribosyl transferase
VVDLLPSFGLFRDRTDAGARLAERLAAYQGQDALVLGIPRGGVPVAAEVARRLEAELDVIVARKLGAPFQPELAIGAVTARGGRYLNERLIREAGVTDDYLEAITAREMAEAARREALFRGGQAPARVEDRVAIVIDDGLATGATMRAAVRALRLHQPSRVVIAVPVAPPQTVEALRRDADEVLAVVEPDPFFAVGVHYRDFRPPEDDEIQRLLMVPRAEG